MSTYKLMKDASGFCYVYTPGLELLSHLTPYEGAIDAAGYATGDAGVDEAKPEPKSRKPKKAADAPPDVVDDVDNALNAALNDDSPVN